VNGLRLAVLGALLSAVAAPTPTNPSTPLYREVLQWEGRDDAAAARKPSEDHWRRVDERKR
jgi:hypothetical protein